MSRRIGRLEPGRHAVEWDLRADDGSRLGPGLYFLEIAGSNGERARQRVVVLR